MSLFQCLGMGTVTSTKDTNTNEIMVYVPALFPTAEGRLTTNVETVQKKSLNAAGETVTSDLMRSNAVPAIWKNMGDNNRLTSPDVREGSQVAIYHILGGNQLYWTTSGVNAETFRLETVINGWSANPNLSENTPFDVDNFYMMKVSTHEGLMAVRTSQANGEATVFDVQIDAKNGRVSVGGGNQSMFVIDDVEESLTYTNKSKSIARIEKKVATIKVDDAINLFSVEQLNIKTKTLRLQAEEAFIDIKKTKWLGDVEHTGDTEQVGDYTQEGDFDQTGDYTQVGDTMREGNSTTSGVVTGVEDVIAPPISLRFHKTSGVRGGPDTSSVPVP